MATGKRGDMQLCYLLKSVQYQYTLSSQFKNWPAHMTQTLSSSADTAALSPGVSPLAAAAWGWQPVRTGSASLVEQLVAHFSDRIRNHGLRTGMRLPSVRALAEQAGVCRDTVVQAYDRLAAQGLVQSRRGAGFFVCAQRALAEAAAAPAASLAQGAAFDTAYLRRGICREDADGSGHTGSAGCLPASWMRRRW